MGEYLLVQAFNLTVDALDEARKTLSREYGGGRGLLLYGFGFIFVLETEGLVIDDLVETLRLGLFAGL